MKNLLVLLVCSLLFLASCNKDDSEYTNLDEYLAVNSDWESNTEIIACAAGGTLDNSAIPDPISIFFYPETNAYDFKYFETENASVDMDDFSNYQEIDLPLSDVFNGYLRKFERDIVSDRFGIVTFRLNQSIWTCRPIRFKASNEPTEVNQVDLKVLDDATQQPTFSWTDPSEEENAIYFQVVSELSDRLITGTYTFDPVFNFYEPVEFAPNITDPNVEPSLEAGRSYRFTLMGVGSDNWVNTFFETIFVLD